MIDAIEGAEPCRLVGAKAFFELADALGDTPIEVIEHVAIGFHLLDRVPFEQGIRFSILTSPADATIQFDSVTTKAGYPQERYSLPIAEGDIEVLLLWVI